MTSAHPLRSLSGHVVLPLEGDSDGQTRYLSPPLDIGLAEVVAFEQQGLAGCFGQRISKGNRSFKGYFGAVSMIGGAHRSGTDDDTGTLFILHLDGSRAVTGLIERCGDLLVATGETELSCDESEDVSRYSFIKNGTTNCGGDCSGSYTNSLDRSFGLDGYASETYDIPKNPKGWVGSLIADPVACGSSSISDTTLNQGTASSGTLESAAGGDVIVKSDDSAAASDESTTTRSFQPNAQTDLAALFISNIAGRTQAAFNVNIASAALNLFPSSAAFSLPALSSSTNSGVQFRGTPINADAPIFGTSCVAVDNNRSASSVGDRGDSRFVSNGSDRSNSVNNDGVISIVLDKNSDLALATFVFADEAITGPTHGSDRSHRDDDVLLEFNVSVSPLGRSQFTEASNLREPLQQKD